MLGLSRGARVVSPISELDIFYLHMHFTACYRSRKSSPVVATKYGSYSSHQESWPNQPCDNSVLRCGSFGFDNNDKSETYRGVVILSANLVQKSSLT